VLGIGGMALEGWTSDHTDPDRADKWQRGFLRGVAGATEVSVWRRRWAG
jgi:hypothetical protein